MARKSTNVRKFKSDSEEADWYATSEGRRQTEREFARALRDGSLSRSAGMKIAKTDPKILERLMQQAKESATRAISIRIPIADLERAKQIAEQTGVGYQTVLKQAIRAGLKKAG
jgi:predicted DNA binding CopG/RHH family protein